MSVSVVALLRAGIPALAAFLAGIILIRMVCRRPALRRLSFALAICALTFALALFSALAPAEAAFVAPYLRFLLFFALAYTAFKAMEVLVLDVLPMGRGAPPPAILRDIVAAVVGGVILVVLLRASFGVDVAALVATSAALSIVVGLALQETLSNLFAGLALMIERPFEPGDWVRIGSHIGSVKEVSWRAVRIQLLRQEDYLIIPNSVIAKTEVVNMSQPTPIHGHAVEIGVVYGEPPNRVRDVLVEAALEVAAVLRQPAPAVELIRFDGFSIVYRLTFWIADFAHLREIEGEVLSHVWYAFRRHDIKIPFPISDVYWRDAHQVSAEAERREQSRLTTLLGGVDFLGALTREQLARLAGEARVAPYPRGLPVVRQGDAGDSLFVIVSGHVEVLAQHDGGGPERSLARLGPGSYFGEMSLLTGAPRSATIRAIEDTELLVLTKEALRPVLLADPAVAERLSHTLARRRAEREDVLQRAAAESATSEREEERTLLSSIRRFFGLIGSEGSFPA